MVILDSSHTKADVLKELEAYAPLVSPGSYIVATDGIMELVHDTPRGKPEWASFSRNQNGGSMKVGSTERSPLGLAPGSNESDERDKSAMQDFTLVIPTYNRPKQLRALLAYLGAEKALCRILILDSSKPRLRTANRKRAELQSNWTMQSSRPRRIPSISSEKGCTR
jgi:hypothetical protein